MSADLFVPKRDDPKVFLEKLALHNGHAVHVSVYGDAVNLALECEDCYELISDTGDDDWLIVEQENFAAWASVARQGKVPVYAAIIMARVEQ